MFRNDVNEVYFEWLLELVCEGVYAKRIQYRRLLRWLHKTEFTYSIPMDANRAEDGIDLRGRFGSPDLDDTPCSVLEMMVALAIRCEDHIMGDPDIGNRTGKWFWGMITNLKLNQMTDSSFNPEYVDEIIDRLLCRRYAKNGEDSLFTVNRRTEDMRKVDIWYQMCWYLDENL